MMGQIDDLYLENLSEFVYDDKKIVTYKYLATMLDVHVNISKQMLYTFYTREKKKGKKIYATYFLSGLAPANTFKMVKEEAMEQDDDIGSEIQMEHCIVLCGCSKLEETKKKFTKLLSVHLYAVSASPIENFQEIKSLSPQTNDAEDSSPPQVRKVFKPFSAVSASSIERFQRIKSSSPEPNVRKSSPPPKFKVSNSPFEKASKGATKSSSPNPKENAKNSKQPDPKVIEPKVEPKTEPHSGAKNEARKRKLPASKSSSEAKRKQPSIMSFFQKK